MAAERTRLSAEDLLAGAVDVAWFGASRAELGNERWAVLHKAAKYASGGNGHRRAQIFAEAMLGQVSEVTLTQRLTAKRNQDAVRALGLLPLPGTEPERQAAAQRRYAVLREFERGSSAFGSQRQASERTAVRIGIENLAHRRVRRPAPVHLDHGGPRSRGPGRLEPGPPLPTENSL